MFATPEAGRPPPIHRTSRRRAGFALSLALHVVVVGAVVQLHWPAHDGPARPAQPRIAWLAGPVQALVAPQVEIVAPDAASTADTAPPAERQPVKKLERPSTRKASVPRTSGAAGESAPASQTPTDNDRPSRAPVDWENERRAAVASVIAERESPRHYVTFSMDDYFPEPAAPSESVPPPFVDDCVLAHGRLQVFMAQMTGRCVRDARGDLFAAIMPAHLTARPVCAETHPDAPGSILADGTEISTVKCELVARTERR